ncbi:stage V sporulation protein D (sporulation-specific penicillin-binding protein) [Anaerosphaera aminiphila DSM 21120]|uniref:Stage V sporulation protein D (Sporulation-specific penicillin-binding protein) n=1 Tax=Anaerosphaera aminiphila DSM 21120 TaxID=1120995 RepID=A0A1M5SYE4_9FIRM|nr:penicillin-binding transpeptidase domain-containing protein [Anaerosphaera aminiphila]SHH43504.1 stage V sporulation protein D (sporulation-specific penicillin-binding protein) [Anaerosphaera aminiphila DSM 21120]
MNKRNDFKELKRENKGTKKNFLKAANSKVFFLFFLLALFFAMIIIKLFSINFVSGKELTRSALNQLTKSETVKADRGIIYDRNKKELVLNVTKSNIYYNMDFKLGSNKKSLSKEDLKELEKDSKKVANILNKDSEEILELMTGSKVVKIASNVSREKGNELREAGIDRLSVEDVIKRYYPYNSLACHVIGFTNDEDTGQYGIEARYDSELSGIAGKNISVKSNSQSQIPLTDEENYAPKEGVNPVLTLDENIQQFAEEAALSSREKHNAEEVSIIVQDTITGEILAMVNNEGYDLNNPKEPVGEEEIESWNELTEEEKLDNWYSNWNNFCVNSQYEPGSTFKLITAAAALEEATTNLQKTYVCNGLYTDIPTVKIGCSSSNRGPRTLEEAMAESCNITFVKIGRELGAEKMLKYIKAFGFGERTGIDLNAEAKGEIPKSASEITPVKLATMSYGHGIAVTPIQYINAVSAIANGGYLNTPRVVDRLEDKNGNIIEKFETENKRRVISEQNSNIMKGLMRKVVEDGTGKLAKVDGYQVGGKTGTANVVLESGKGYDQNNYISSFVGVAPLNDPKITVMVIVQKPKGDFFGSTVAVPAGHDVIEKSLEYLNIPKTEKSNKNDDENLVLVPNVNNLLLSDAGKELVDLGLQFNVKSNTISNSAVVVKQNPAAGNYVPKDSIVDLEINNNTSNIKIMPDLNKKNEEELKSVLDEMEVDYNIKGKGHAISQSIKAGEKINEGSRVTIEMSISESELEDEAKAKSNVKENNLSKNKNSRENEENNLKNKKNNSKDKNSSKDKELSKGKKDNTKKTTGN